MHTRSTIAILLIALSSVSGYFYNTVPNGTPLVSRNSGLNGFFPSDNYNAGFNRDIFVNDVNRLNRLRTFNGIFGGANTTNGTVNNNGLTTGPTTITTLNGVTTITNPDGTTTTITGDGTTTINNTIGGVNNLNAFNGFNGVNGINGFNGINGLTGFNGINGVNGLNNFFGLNNGINGLGGFNLGFGGFNGFNGASLNLIGGGDNSDGTFTNPIFLGSNGINTTSSSSDPSLAFSFGNVNGPSLNLIGGGDNSDGTFTNPILLSSNGINTTNGLNNTGNFNNNGFNNTGDNQSNSSPITRRNLQNPNRSTIPRVSPLGTPASTEANYDCIAERCNDENFPVCSTDNKTFRNECYLQCFGATYLRDGVCTA